MIPNPPELSPTSLAPDWLNELDFDAGGPPTLRMGVRPLDPHDWLIVDDRYRPELRHKAAIIAAEPDIVVSWQDERTRAEADELLRLVITHLRENHDLDTAASMSGDELHPLEAASRVAQEDFTLIRATDEGPVMTAAAVCFPNGWYPNAKVGLPLAAVHDPIPGYASELAAKVDRVFMNLRPGRILWRRNWFIYESPALYHPEDPAPVGPDGPAALFLRSERETMRALPETGALVFTIRTQQVALAAIEQRPDIAAAMATYFRDSPPVAAAHKGAAPYLNHVLNLCDRWS